MGSANERAAKCMGYSGPRLRSAFNPEHSLDDAALVEAEAIRRTSTIHYYASLLAELGASYELADDPWIRIKPTDLLAMVTATAEQRCLAAVRLMEQRR